MFKCDRCGKRIDYDRPQNCFFCGKTFTIEEGTKSCPTCNAGYTGDECIFCGDSICNDGSSSYDHYIKEQEKMRRKKNQGQ